MKAALLTQPGKIELHEVPDPSPGPRDVVVRNDAVGVCGSDVHIYHGHINWHLDAHGQPIPLEQHPQVLGHEIAGTIVQTGSAVDDLEVGQRVVVDQGLNCASEGRSSFCEYCATGYSHHCEHYREHGITGLPGGFAELIRIPAVNAVSIRSGLASSHAAMTEPLGCVLHSLDLAQRQNSRYHINADDPEQRVRSIIICGGGPAGQLFLQAIRSVMNFQGRVFLSDPDPDKLRIAETAGATPIPTCGDESVAETVERETRGRLCELVVDACGAPSMWSEFARLLRKQGTAILYGFGRERGAAGTLDEIQWRGATLVATSGASGSIDADGRPEIYRRALNMLEESTVDVSELLTHRYHELGQLNRALGFDPGSTGYLKGVFEIGN